MLNNVKSATYPSNYALIKGYRELSDVAVFVQSLKQNVKNLKLSAFAISGPRKSCKLGKTLKDHIWIIWGPS